MIERPNRTAGHERKKEFSHLVTSPACSIFPWILQKTHFAFLGQYVSTETHQLYLLSSEYGISSFSSYTACRQMIHHWTNFFQYSSSSSSSVSAGRSDNPPWKCSWQMCAWRSSITATIRENELYPLAPTMQCWCSALLLYGKHPGHDVPAVIPGPCACFILGRE